MPEAAYDAAMDLAGKHVSAWGFVHWTPFRLPVRRFWMQINVGLGDERQNKLAKAAGQPIL